MEINNWSYECYICNSKLKYIGNKEIENKEWICFKCTKCEKEILTPINNLYINKRGVLK